MTDNQATWAIDPAHSTVEFTVRHLVSRVRGHFQEFAGHIVGDPENLMGAQAEFSAQVASVNTNQPQRDEHLRTSDFFDAEHYPTLTFKSSRIEKKDATTYTVWGDFTLRGVTKEIPVTVEFLGISKDPWGGTRAGFEATARVNRKDFGVNWNQVLEAGSMMVGDMVDLHVGLEVVKQ